MRVVIVGAGLGGLSAAAHLVNHGHEVTVIERDAVPGGRVGSFAAEGFRIDTGPSHLTMPGLLADTFAAAGRELSDYLELAVVDPMYRATFADGSALHVHHDRERMAEQITQFAGAADAAAYLQFCDWIDRLFLFEMPHFVDTNYNGYTTALRHWRAGLELARLGGFKRLHRKLSATFGDERLRQLFGFHSLMVGLAPQDALGVGSVASFLHMRDGIYLPRGGMHAVPVALARAVTDAGVSIRYSSPVTRILRGGDNAVTGVEIGGSERVAADAVVCNADLPVAYRTLLGGVDAPRPARRGRYGPGFLLWVAGVRGEPTADIAQHNIHFGDRPHENLRSVIKRGLRMSDPITLVSVPSLGDPELAPEGSSTLYALEPVPNLDGKVNWSRDGERFATDLRRRMAVYGYPRDVVVEQTFDPLDWESMGLERGTPWGLSHVLRQSGPFRPSNVDHRVPGLFFAGASTLPGNGVPLVLLSGKLAARRVRQYAESTRVVRW